MAGWKSSIATVLAALCIAVASGSVMPTWSGIDAGVYDPWMDVDDNGIVNMLDLYLVAQKYGTTGTPLDKAVLPEVIRASVTAANELISYFPRQSCTVLAQLTPR